jgi:hypothetical protein
VRLPQNAAVMCCVTALQAKPAGCGLGSKSRKPATRRAGLAGAGLPAMLPIIPGRVERMQQVTRDGSKFSIVVITQHAHENTRRINGRKNKCLSREAK